MISMIKAYTCVDIHIDSLTLVFEKIELLNWVVFFFMYTEVSEVWSLVFIVSYASFFAFS